MEEVKDIQPHETRQKHKNPIFQQLQLEVSIKKPHNILRFIKSWAATKLKEVYSSDEQQSILNKKPKVSRRRNAIYMPIFQKISFEPERKIKSQQHLSRILLKLRSFLMLNILTHDQIFKIAESMKAIQYQNGETVLNIGDQMRKLFIIGQGQVIKQIKGAIRGCFLSGDSFCQQSVLYCSKSLFRYQCKNRSLIYQIQGGEIHLMVKQAHKAKYNLYLDLLSNLSIYSLLDNQEITKLTDLISQETTYSGQVVLDFDQNLTRTIFIIDGQFQQCRRKLDGTLQPYRNLRIGQCFGQTALQQSIQSDTIVVSKSQGKIAVLQRHQLQRSIQPIERIKVRRKINKQ